MIITSVTTDGWSTKKGIMFRLIFVYCTCPLIVISHQIWLLYLIVYCFHVWSFQSSNGFRKSRHCRNSHGVRRCVSCDAHFISVAVTLLTLGWIKNPLLVQNTNLHREQALVVPLDPCFGFAPTSLTCQCVRDVRIRSNLKAGDTLSSHHVSSCDVTSAVGIFNIEFWRRLSILSTLLTSRDLTWRSGRLTCQRASQISVVAHISWNVTYVSSALQHCYQSFPEMEEMLIEKVRQQNVLYDKSHQIIEISIWEPTHGKQ
jgi:hypothetical protein